MFWKKNHDNEEKLIETTHTFTWIKSCPVCNGRVVQIHMEGAHFGETITSIHCSECGITFEHTIWDKFENTMTTKREEFTY